MRALLLSLFVLFFFGGEAVGQNRIVVYFPDYRYRDGMEFHWYDTTHLILFSAKPNEDGSVDFSRITPGLFKTAENYRNKGRKDGKVLVCVGGWGRGKVFASAVASAETRNRFVADLDLFISKHNLDGVDLDWEFPRGDVEHANYTLFLEELSGKLRASSKILSVALGPTRPLPIEAYQYIDEINLMSYQPWSPTDYKAWMEKSVTQALVEGVDSRKINVGIPFFTKEMGGERRAISWKKLMGDGSIKIPESKYGFTPVGAEVCDLRVKMVDKYKLGGYMIWDYGHDTSDPKNSLLKYLSRKVYPVQ